MPLEPARTVAELKELRELTGDKHGAQRVAWTDTWERAREWLRGKPEGLPLEYERDEVDHEGLRPPGRRPDPAVELPAAQSAASTSRPVAILHVARPRRSPCVFPSTRPTSGEAAAIE